MVLKRATTFIRGLLEKRRKLEENSTCPEDRWKSRRYIELTEKHGESTSADRLKNLRRKIYEKKDLQYIQKSTNELLAAAKSSIAQGQTPIILLPDTSMRIAGHLFHTALVEAFPDVYRELKRYRLGPVLYISTLERQTGTCIPSSTAIARIPEVVKRIKKPRFFVLDLIVSKNTIDAIGQELQRLGLPNATYHNIQEEDFNSTTRLSKPKRSENSKGYAGRGGVLKRTSGPMDAEPEIVTARESDYNPKIKFWLEKEYKAYLSKMGRELGQEFRKREMKK
ncbi:MAG: hypothetical protein PHH82_03540 [Candidatus ainarchaeum sp.]|nr:hypothetical protein [Candidatus ainarchaeum sp.]